MEKLSEAKETTPELDDNAWRIVQQCILLPSWNVMYLTDEYTKSSV